MQFSRTLSFLLSLFALGSFVMASPTPTKRQADQAQISSTLSTLQTTVEGDITSLKALDPSTATLSQVQPYITDIINAFNTAGSALTPLESSSKREVIERQTAFDEEVAALLATLISDLAAALQGLLGVPGLGSILPGLAGPINVVLEGLGILLDGVLTLVANLLVDVAGLLDEVGLGLLDGTLGL